MCKCIFYSIVIHHRVFTFYMFQEKLTVLEMLPKAGQLHA